MVILRKLILVSWILYVGMAFAVAQTASTNKSKILSQSSLNQNHNISVVSVDADKEKTRSAMRSAWYHWDPYQFEKILGKTDERVLTGLDIKLARATLNRAGISVIYTPLQWQAHQKALEMGTKDMAAGAFINPARQKYAWFSNQYRYEDNVLYVKRGTSNQYAFDSVKTMLNYFKTHKFRLGVVKGYSYALPIINDYVNDPANKHLIVPVKNEVANFRNLKQGKIDGFIVDRIVGATIAWRNGLQKEVEEHPGFFARAGIHFMFSKKTVSEETLNKINKTIAIMQRDGSYRKITEQYLFPVLLNMTIESHWFFALDIVGTIAFALSGLIIAMKEHYSIVGAFVLASLPAVGGGVIRDILVSRHPIGIIRTPVYLLVVMGVVVIGYMLIMLFRWLNYGSFAVPKMSVKKTQAQGAEKNRVKNRFAHITALQFFDAIGLAAFTITGVTVAVEARLDPLWLWAPLLAAITSSGGGILRDIVRSRKDIASLTGALYPEISVMWGIILYFLLELESSDPNMDRIFLWVLFVLFGTFLTRMVAMLLRWHSLIF